MLRYVVLCYVMLCYVLGYVSVHIYIYICVYIVYAHVFAYVYIYYMCMQARDQPIHQNAVLSRRLLHLSNKIRRLWLLLARMRGLVRDC